MVVEQQCSARHCPLPAAVVPEALQLSSAVALARSSLFECEDDEPPAEELNQWNAVLELCFHYSVSLLFCESRQLK